MGSAEKLFLLVWAAILFGPAVKAALKKSKTPPKRPHSSFPPRPPPTILRRRPDPSAPSPAPAEQVAVRPAKRPPPMPAPFPAPAEQVAVRAAKRPPPMPAPFPAPAEQGAVRHAKPPPPMPAPSPAPPADGLREQRDRLSASLREAQEAALAAMRSAAGKGR